MYAGVACEGLYYIFAGRHVSFKRPFNILMPQGKIKPLGIKS